MFFFKSVNIWQSYKPERGCLMHFLHLLAVCWPDAKSAFWPTLLLKWYVFTLTYVVFKWI